MTYMRTSQATGTDKLKWITGSAPTGKSVFPHVFHEHNDL